MSESVDSKLLLYADDSCLVFQDRDPKVIERQLNKDFTNLCDWFIDNKLSIHFGEEKTKFIIFTTKRKMNRKNSLDIVCKDIKIKQYSKVTYLGCVLDESLSGEAMALNAISKSNRKLNRENNLL